MLAPGTFQSLSIGKLDEMFLQTFNFI